MTTPALRVLRDAAGPAAWNMAVDEALLLGDGPPTLRLYGWQPHAVSLGYFQRFADFADVPADVPIVRRITGGGAIHHGDERTFALAIDQARLPRDIDASYRLLHQAVLAALATLGVTGTLLDGGDAPTPRPEQRWCFRDPGRGDIVTPRGKLLGSAQRRVQQPRPWLLHHGSLVLTRPALTPFTAAVADTSPADAVLRTRLDEALIAALAKALALEPAIGTLTAAERTHATRLAARHADPAFVRRR